MFPWPWIFKIKISSFFRITKNENCSAAITDCQAHGVLLQYICLT